MPNIELLEKSMPVAPIRIAALGLENALAQIIPTARRKLSLFFIFSPPCVVDSTPYPGACGDDAIYVPGSMALKTV